MLAQNFVLFGVLLQFLGGLPYLIDTIRGKIQPNKVSWLLWSIAPLVAFAAEVMQGIGIQSLATFITGFVPLLIFAASFFNKKAQWHISKLDVLCGVCSFLGIILWYSTKTGNIAIFFSIIADGFAAVSTLYKSYYEPKTENDAVYLLGIGNAGIALLVIKRWNFTSYGFPLYLLIVDIIFVLLIRFRLGSMLRSKK